MVQAVTFKRVGTIALLAALTSVLAALMAAAPAEAATATMAQINFEGASKSILKVVGLFILVISIGYAAMKIGRGAVVPAVLILVLGGIMYVLSTSPSGPLKKIGTELLGWFGLK